MKKNLLFSVALTGIIGLNAQTYKDMIPACFVQGVDINCSSACGDFNGDGYDDIFKSGWGGEVRLFLNEVPKTPTGMTFEQSEAVAVYVSGNTVEIRLDTASPVNCVVVYDMAGKTICQSSFSGAETAFEIPLVGEGCYVLSVQSGTVNHSTVIRVK